MRRGISKTAVIISIALLLLIILALVVIPAISTPKIPAATLPVPNAFDTMVEAGSLVTGVPEEIAESEDVDALREFVETNTDALELAEQAMSEKGMVPVDYGGGFQKQLPDQQTMRQTMRLLLGKGRMEELEGRFGDAAKTYAKLFALSNKCGQGGLFIHHMMACAGERMGLENLERISDKLTDEEKSEVATLLSVARQPVDSEQMQAREYAVVKGQHGNLAGSWMIYMASSPEAKNRVEEVDAEIQDLLQKILAELTDQ